MHIVVSWDITGNANLNRGHWEDQLKAVILQYSWVRPLTTFYVVQIPDPYARQIIVDGLVRVSTSAGGLINVVVSPPMSGGTYQGSLPRDLWPELNKRSA